jgi:hypothetical protein
MRTTSYWVIAYPARTGKRADGPYGTLRDARSAAKSYSSAYMILKSGFDGQRMSLEIADDVEADTQQRIDQATRGRTDR